jgi:plastocyanin
VRRLSMLLVLVGLLLPAAASAEVKTFRLRTHSFTLGRYATQFPKIQVPTPRLKGYVTRMHAVMVDRRGRPVTIAVGMLHHIFFNNLDHLRTDGNCSARIPEVFYGTGEENEVLTLPPGYGYRLRAHDRWQLTGMLMSHRWQREKVWIRYDVTVDSSRHLTGVRPLWVRANGCGQASSYHVRGGGSPSSIDDRVNHWTVPLTGRIVAAGGHLHAGSINMQLRDPACGNRVLFDNRPYFAAASDLLYHVVPRLHEAGPVQTSWFTSQTGIPVAKGQVLDLHGIYSNQYARQSVMAITHIYVAPAKHAPVGCPPLPADRQQTTMKAGERTSAPYQPIPLYTLDAHHRPVVEAQPPGTVLQWPAGGTIDLKAFRFQPSEKVIVKSGATIKWRFDDVTDHNLTLASGPSAVAGQTMHRGQRTSTQFTVPGRYQVFCYLHPMTMHEQIDVVP